MLATAFHVKHRFNCDAYAIYFSYRTMYVLLRLCLNDSLIRICSSHTLGVSLGVIMGRSKMMGPLSEGGSSTGRLGSAVVVELVSLGRGVTGRVSSADLEAKDAAYLRALGVRPNARVRVCRTGEPIIVEVLAAPGEGPCGCDCACRVGLSRELASRILVCVDAGA